MTLCTPLVPPTPAYAIPNLLVHTHLVLPHLNPILAHLILESSILAMPIHSIDSIPSPRITIEILLKPCDLPHERSQVPYVRLLAVEERCVNGDALTARFEGGEDLGEGRGEDLEGTLDGRLPC